METPILIITINWSAVVVLIVGGGRRRRRERRRGRKIVTEIDMMMSIFS